MSTLALVAASGLAREVLAVPGVRERYDEIVVIDDDPARWGSLLDDCPVLVGGLPRVADLDDVRLLLCAGSGRVRRELAVRLLGIGGGHHYFAKVVHPTVQLPAGCTVAAGSILLAQTVLTADVRVGAHVVAMPGVTLTHDDLVDDFATLCAGVSLGGGVHVGEAAYVGMNACVREHVRVGRGATLGMGAALLTDLPDRETWAGVPARPLLRQATAIGA
jgi:sugar O-acyltransferase (sialic acid O-acetyltransferase NeuD family)